MKVWMSAVCGELFFPVHLSLAMMMIIINKYDLTLFPTMYRQMYVRIVNGTVSSLD